MKNIISSRMLLACAALGFAFMGEICSAQLSLISPTLNNGGFESTNAFTGVQANFTGSASSTGVIPFWGTLNGVNAGNSGVATSAGPVVGGSFAGNAYSFVQNGGTNGAFNLVTGYTIAAGDMFSLTWESRDSSSGGGQEIVTLFSQLNPAGSTYSYAPIATLASLTQTLINSSGGSKPYALFTLNYTALAGDAGNDI